MKARGRGIEMLRDLGRCIRRGRSGNLGRWRGQLTGMGRVHSKGRGPVTGLSWFRIGKEVK